MVRNAKGRSTVIDLTGQRFTRLVATRFLGMRGHHALWECLCDCGKVHAVTGGNLKKGHGRSCGCLALENRKNNKFKTHGMTRSPEFSSWMAMRRRCERPDNNRYYRYGGRGIKICERWLGPAGFVNFLADMGPRPTLDHSIDRYPDNDGNYEPSNCRWATRIQQWDNRRKKEVKWLSSTVAANL